MRWCSEQGLPHSALLAWDAVDRAKLMAWLTEKADQCGMCGTSRWEWEEDPYAYEPVVDTCPGCYRREISREDAKGPGATINLIPKARAEKMRMTPKSVPRRKDR